MHNFIRWMLPMDLDQVATVERQSFAQPWERDHIKRSITHRHQIGYVHTATGGLVDGWVLYRIEKGCLQLVRVAVLSDARRSGVGTMLVKHVRSKLSKKRPWMGAWMDERDTAGLQFLSSVGFSPMEHLGFEGLVVMRLDGKKAQRS